MMRGPLSRRRLIAGGLAGIAGASGLAVAAHLADRYGLPGAGGIWGPGATLTYAAHRVLTGNALAREFPREMISKAPFINGGPPKDEIYRKHQAAGLTDWRLAVDGLVAQPTEFAVAEIPKCEVRGLPFDQGELVG